MRYLPPLLFSCLISVSFWSCQSNPEKPTEQAVESDEEVTEEVPDAGFAIEYITGHFEPEEHPEFIEIDSVYADRSGMYLRKDAYTAFIEMHDAAEEVGVELVIRSAARNFNYQKGIWERKWTGETKIENGKDASVVYTESKDRALAILQFSSMPGTSRHHWGTDIDLNSFENSWFESGEGKKVYDFLVENGARYGYCQPYTQKGELRPDGYEEEKWHWSYIPVAGKLTDRAESALRDSMIVGFKGAEAAIDISVVEKYVLGINPECR